MENQPKERRPVRENPTAGIPLPGVKRTIGFGRAD